MSTLKWLTLNDIKDQCRIERSFTLEDRMLTLYGCAAENALLNAMRRTYDDLVDEYGGIPDDLVVAGLLLANHLYEHHGPTENVTLSAVPYSLDIYWKPYAILAD